MIRDQFETRPDGRAGDITASELEIGTDIELEIWAEERQRPVPQRDWLSAAVWWGLLLAGAGLWAVIFWLLGAW